jgi:hypothetical protein
MMISVQHGSYTVPPPVRPHYAIRQQRPVDDRLQTGSRSPKASIGSPEADHTGPDHQVRRPHRPISLEAIPYQN